MMRALEVASGLIGGGGALIFALVTPAPTPAVRVVCGVVGAALLFFVALFAWRVVVKGGHPWT